LYYCNMVEWFWWNSSLISTINWFPSHSLTLMRQQNGNTCKPSIVWALRLSWLENGYPRPLLWDFDR